MTSPRLQSAASPRLLGAGGEAEIFEVAGRPGLAYKRYRQPTPARTAKLRVMLAHPPAVDRTSAAIAWPVELVPGPGGEAAGFLMPRIDVRTSQPLFRLYNPQSRHRLAPGFSWRYLLRTARNVAAVVDAVHRAGYVIGDLNESNLLVTNRALVALVDCDSMQVRDPGTGEVHRCRVGKPEFTAPELHRVDLDAEDRTQSSDVFALAVLVFHLLLEGVHPFGGVWRGRGEPPDIAQRIRAGLFPYRRSVRSLAPPPMSLALDVLPPEVRKLVRRTFTTGMRWPRSRPTAAEWVVALEGAEAEVVRCQKSPHHEHGRHLRRCPWCARIDAGLPDPFPGPSGRSDLRPTPPSRAEVLWAGARQRCRAGARAGVLLLLRSLRTVPAATLAVLRGARSPALREVHPPAARAFGVELPALLVVAGSAAIVPVPVSAGLLLLGLPIAHSVAQARAGRTGRWRRLVASAAGVPRNLAAGARTVAVSAAVAAAIVGVTAVVLRLLSGAVAGDLVDDAWSLRSTGFALAAVLALRWPSAGDAAWGRSVDRAAAAAARRVHGRRLVVLWAAAAASVVAMALRSF